MATQVQTRRGTTAEHSTFTGAAGELTVDTDKEVVVVHDGSTAGGHPMLRQDQANLPSSAPSNGVYVPSANNVAISTNGTGKLFIDDVGRVSVGIANNGTAKNIFQVNSENIPGDGIGIYSDFTAQGAELGAVNFYPSASSNGASARIVAIDDRIGGMANRYGSLAFHTAFNSTTAEKMRLLNSGNLGIGDNAPDSTLTIKAATSVVPLRVSGPSSEFARIDTSGRLLIGTSSATGNIRLNQKLTVVTAGSNVFGGASLVGYTGTNSVYRPILDFKRSRGTTDGSMTSVASGDDLGVIAFFGSDGNQFIETASINCAVDGTPGTNDMPGRLVFSTTPDGDSSPDEVMRITSNKYVRLASGTGGIQFGGDTAAANALDDYEEGTFTPYLYGDGYGDWPGETANSGFYTRVGRIVHCHGYVSWTSRVGAGATIVRFRGLPFGSTSTSDAAPYIRYNSTELFDAIRLQSSTSSTHFRTGGAIQTLTDFSTSGAISFNFTYRVS